MSKKDNNKAEKFSKVLNKLFEQEGIKYEKLISVNVGGYSFLYIISKKKDDAKVDSDRLYGINKVYLQIDSPVIYLYNDSRSTDSTDMNLVVENKIPLIYSDIYALGARDHLSLICWNERFIPFAFTLPDGTIELKYVPYYNSHKILDCAKNFDKKEIRYIDGETIYIKEKNDTNNLLRVSAISSTEVETEKLATNFNDIHVMYNGTINIRTINGIRIINETIKNGEITDRKILYGKIVFQNDLFYIVLNNKALRIYNLSTNEMLYELEGVKDIEELKDSHTDNSKSSNLYDYIGIIFAIRIKNKKKQLLHIYDQGGRVRVSLDKDEYDDLFYKGFIDLGDSYDYGYTVEGIKGDEVYKINEISGNFETIKTDEPKQLRKNPQN